MFRVVKERNEHLLRCQWRMPLKSSSQSSRNQQHLKLHQSQILCSLKKKLFEFGSATGENSDMTSCPQREVKRTTNLTFSFRRQKAKRLVGGPDNKNSENSENSYDNSSSHHRWHSTNKAELWTENYIVKIYSFIH